MDVYKLLSNDEELVSLLNELRGSEFDPKGVYKTGIFTNDIPDDFKKVDLAPFIRIEMILEKESDYFGDDNYGEEQRCQVSYWSTSLSASNKIKKRIDEVLKASDLRQYDAGRYPDPDIKPLLFNYRKFRRTQWL